MRIFNVRLGFATNSSSTHSIVHVRDPSGVNDKDVEDGEFGWNFFTAKSARAKQSYMAQILKATLSQNLPNDMVEIIVKEWVGVPLDKHGYVDHQSCFVIPRTHGQIMPSRELFDELMENVLRPEVAILGGNDNDDHNHYLVDEGKVELPFVTGLPEDAARAFMDDHGVSMRPDYCRDWICRKDSDEWVLFNQGTGTKIRCRMDGVPAKKVERALVPELVDLKITERCHCACEYCYQSSSSAGTDAIHDDLYSIAWALSEMGVFEVAIGGGDPVLHPKFAELLGNFRKNDVVPNFSTRSLDWMRNPEIRDSVKENCGAFAISTTDRTMLPRLAALVDDNGFDRNKVKIHVPMGIMESYEFPYFIEDAIKLDLGVVALGFKRAGRGLKYSPKQYSDWIIDVKKANRKVTTRKDFPWTLSADTTLMEESKKNGWAGYDEIPEKLYRLGEGKFSCYIDAVGGVIAPSSFSDDKHTLDFADDLKAQILDKFKGF